MGADKTVGQNPSKQALDWANESGMERGMRETLDQLDALVASMG